MLNNNTPTRLGKQEIACEKNETQPKCNSLIGTGLSLIFVVVICFIIYVIDRLES